MHLTLPRNQLLATLTPLQSLTTGISTVPIVPILQTLLLEASADVCRITATDLEITARRQLPAQVHAEGAVALPTAPLRAIINEFDHADIDLTVDAALRATISCKESTITLQGLPKDDFPSIRAPRIDGMALNRSIFLDLLRHTLFAASSDPTRLMLNSVLLRVDSHQLQTVATDGRRLAIARAGTGAADRASIDAIIPRKAAATILKLWPQKGETIAAEVTNGHLLLHGDDTLLDARLREGSFVTYEPLIPVTPSRQATVDRDALLAALRQTSTILEEPIRPVAFTLTPGRLTLHSSNLDLGEARARLDAAYHQDEITIGFNAHYLLESCPRSAAHRSRSSWRIPPALRSSAPQMRTAPAMSSRRSVSHNARAASPSASSPYLALAAQVGRLVTAKQARYGDSFSVAPRILRLLYPDGIRPAQYDTLLSIVRVLDKLKRLATNHPRDAEDPWLDIAGYSLLALHATRVPPRRAARRQAA